MQCVEFERILENQADEPLSSSAAVHLESCGDCRMLRDDLDSIRAAGREWGADEPAPSERVWIALRAQLEAEGVIREARQPRFSGFGGFLGYRPRLALAGAYLTLLLVGAALIGSQTGKLAPGDVTGKIGAGATVTEAGLPGSASAEPRPNELGQTLDGDVKRVMAMLPQQDSVLVTSFEKNLGIVDDLIAVCEQSVREQPGNPVARQYLYGAYQQKAVLLATAMDHSTLEDR